MSAEVQGLVWKYSPHKGSTLIVFLALADWSDPEGVSWPSIATLALKTRQSERNTQYCIRELEQSGYLKVVKRKETSSKYCINLVLLEGGAKIAPIPDEGVQNGTEGVQNSAENLRSVAPNTLVIRQEVHTLTNNPSQEDFSLVSDNPKDHRSSKADSKKNCDPRCKAVTAKIFQAYSYFNKVNPGWGNVEGNLLKLFLSSHLEWPEEKIFDCIRNRFKSEENLALEPRRWISRLGDFAGGPLDKFGKPKTNGNGHHNAPSSHTNGSGTTGHLLDHLPGVEDIKRRRAEDDKRLELRRAA